MTDKKRYGQNKFGVDLGVSSVQESPLPSDQDTM